MNKPLARPVPLFPLTPQPAAARGKKKGKDANYGREKKKFNDIRSEMRGVGN